VRKLIATEQVTEQVNFDLLLQQDKFRNGMLPPSVVAQCRDLAEADGIDVAYRFAENDSGEGGKDMPIVSLTEPTGRSISDTAKVRN
jgi:hypothetical protein